MSKVLKYVSLSNYLLDTQDADVKTQDDPETEQTVEKGAYLLRCALVNINSPETCKTWKILQKFA